MRSLRIAVDASAVPQDMAGAGVYTYQLVRALAEAKSPHEIVVFARTDLFDDLVQREQLRVVNIPPSSRGRRLIWEQTELPVLLRRLRIDVLHSPHHHTPIAARLPLGARTKLVVTMHDLTFMRLPQRYPLARRLYMQAVTRASALAANAIITPSQTVRHEVIERLRFRAERVVAIPEAAASNYVPVPRAQIEEVRARCGLPERYVLSVGSLEPGKNRARLLRAVAALRDKGIDCTVVIVGQPAWMYEQDYDLVRELGLSGRVIFLGYVPDRDMPALYSGATLFAFPSLYEGFGLPVLEAMACGTPVVTSNVSATAEVANDAALLVDPLHTQAIVTAIEALLSDDSLRSDLRERGLRRASEFSWERAAHETLLLYELVAAQ
jgi:glycosyltransferase involved in cell wall biosynthesis